jgi:hypothetical protein
MRAAPQSQRVVISLIFLRRGSVSARGEPAERNQRESESVPIPRGTMEDVVQPRRYPRRVDEPHASSAVVL